MRKLFIDGFDGEKTSVFEIKGEDVEHLHALRVKIGDCLLVSDGKINGKCFEVKIAEIRKKSIIIDNIVEKSSNIEPKVKITVCIAALKGGKIDEIIRQSTEIGASAIVVFQSENCVCVVEKRDKAERYQKIAKQAAMQSGRDIVPTVEVVESYDEMLNILQNHEYKAIFHEKSTEIFYEKIKNIEPPKTIAFAVGPEGGFSENEIEKAKSLGIDPLLISNRVLRAATVPLFVLSVFSAVFD